MDAEHTPIPDDPDGSQQSVAHEPQPVRRPRRRLRVLSTFAATALVAGVAGYAVGHTDAPASSASGPRSTTFAPPDHRSNGSNGGGWGFSHWSDGLQGQPGSGGSGIQGGGGTTGDATSRASAAQMRGLVRVVSTMKYTGGKAAGTGMVLTSDGEVVTNHHVVEGATSVRVTVMSTGTSYQANVVGTDAKDDVAVLHLSGASGLTTVRTDTDTVSTGDRVTAVGDANGTAGYLSAATGHVLAKGRSITTQAEGSAASERLTGLLEISSDVVSGDSGGATYDGQGEVLGMTTAASTGADPEGYVIPIATVLRVAGDLDNGMPGSSYTYHRPAFLGIALDGSTSTVQGVYAGTPAARMGLQAGDRITAVGSRHVSTSAQLRAAIGAYSPGDRVELTWTGPTGGGTRSGTTALTAGPVR
jgi:S1-C subfamily serine protease